MRRSLSGHTVFGNSMAALSDHRKRIGSEPQRKSAVNRRFATSWSGLATRRYGLTTSRRPRVSLRFQIIRDRFDLSFVIRDRASNCNRWRRCAALRVLLGFEGISAAEGPGGVVVLWGKLGAFWGRALGDVDAGSLHWRTGLLHRLRREAVSDLYSQLMIFIYILQLVLLSLASYQLECPE